MSQRVVGALPIREVCAHQGSSADLVSEHSQPPTLIVGQSDAMAAQLRLGDELGNRASKMSLPAQAHALAHGLHHRYDRIAA